MCFRLPMTSTKSSRLHNDIDGTQAHANVQLEELPDSATIRLYTCPCQCEDDHEGYELQPPAISYRDWIAPDMGSPYGHGCIPSAFLRMTQARLDCSAAEIMADTSIYEQRTYWLQQARTRLYRPTRKNGPETPSLGEAKRRNKDGDL
jgi:hypothetical protein